MEKMSKRTKKRGQEVPRPLSRLSRCGQPPACLRAVVFIKLDADEAPPGQPGCQKCAAGSAERVKHDVVRI